MAALDAAFAFAQDFHVAVLVGQQLKFDMPRRADVFFQIDVGRTERRARFALRLREQAGQVFRLDSRRAFRVRRRRPKLSG